jgi:flagellar biosynthesis protein FliQ
VPDLGTSILHEALSLALWLSLPTLGAGLLVALVVSAMQAFTQLSEPALNAIPRALAVGLTLALAGSWMGGELLRFAGRLLRDLPQLVR